MATDGQQWSKTMQTLATLGNGYTLIALDYNDRSPMADHSAMEIAADDDRKRVYAHALLLHTYGLDSVKAACERYKRAAQ